MQAKTRTRRISVGISLFIAAAGAVLANAPNQAPRPVERPAELAATLVALGPICGVDDIIGRTIPTIAVTEDGCGIADPVLVSEVRGVTLSKPTRMDCETATALSDWTQVGVLDLLGDFRGGVDQFQVAAGYVCRPRYGQAGNKLSEHAKGKAIDISAFTMGDGSRITLLRDWDKGQAGAFLDVMHDRACGIFGTVLGPDANAAHADHFHFDTADYRGGSYCR